MFLLKKREYKAALNVIKVKYCREKMYFGAFSSTNNISCGACNVPLKWKNRNKLHQWKGTGILFEDVSSIWTWGLGSSSESVPAQGKPCLKDLMIQGQQWELSAGRAWTMWRMWYLTYFVPFKLYLFRLPKSLFNYLFISKGIIEIWGRHSRFYIINSFTSSK